MDYVGGSLYPDSQNISNWLNRAAFAFPATGTFGNSGYNIARGPGRVNFDVSLVKRTTLFRENTLQFRAEFFNIFNHAPLNNPNTQFNNSLFGRITAAGDGRQIQLVLRYQF